MLVDSFLNASGKLPIYCESSSIAFPFCLKLEYEALNSFSVPLATTTDQQAALYWTFCMKLDLESVRECRQ